MNIGVDFDGVIVDTERNARFWADYHSWFNLHQEKQRFDDLLLGKCYNWPKEEILKFLNNEVFEILRTSGFVVGAKEILTQLKEDGHQLYLITARGSFNENEIGLAEDNLRELGVQFDGLCWKTKDKLGKCKELGIDVMIDDSPTIAEQFNNEKINLLYFREPKLRHVQGNNIHEVDSWMDIYRTVYHLNKEKLNNNTNEKELL